MNVVMKIQNRDALLLWTVPYVTGHYPSMDMVIDELAEPKEFAEVLFPQAFMFRKCAVTYLPSNQWIDVQARMERLSEQVGDDNEEWRHKSIEIIRSEEPVYIWLDEFQRWFDWHVENERGYSGDKSLTLCFSPIMPEEHAVYLEKTFGNLGTNNPQVEAVENVPKVDDTAKPWLIPHPKDPKPEHPWYVPARYFARKLVLDDSTLLTKRGILAGKVAISLDNVGIKKRGGTKQFASGTIKKALSNIKFG